MIVDLSNGGPQYPLQVSVRVGTSLNRYIYFILGSLNARAEVMVALYRGMVSFYPAAPAYHTMHNMGRPPADLPTYAIPLEAKSVHISALISECTEAYGHARQWESPDEATNL